MVADDGGETYQTTANPFTGNEQSIAQLGDGSLYMNGRGTQFPWGNRTSYRSRDGGATWTAGAPTPLTDVNCEAAVIAVVTDAASATAGSSTVLFLSEPTGPGRVSFRVHCSCDGGITWPSSLVTNPGQVAAYSSLLALPPVAGGSGKGRLLAVWEQHPNQLVHIYDTDWCTCMQ